WELPRRAAASVDPVLGGEAGLPPLTEDELHAVLDDQLPQWRASGLLVPYAIFHSEPRERVRAPADASRQRDGGPRAGNPAAPARPHPPDDRDRLRAVRAGARPRR